MNVWMLVASGGGVIKEPVGNYERATRLSNEMRSCPFRGWTHPLSAPQVKGIL
jgi:hypothetical protein